MDFVNGTVPLSAVWPVPVALASAVLLLVGLLLWLRVDQVLARHLRAEQRLADRVRPPAEDEATALAETITEIRATKGCLQAIAVVVVAYNVWSIALWLCGRLPAGFGFPAVIVVTVGVVLGVLRHVRHALRPSARHREEP